MYHIHTMGIYDDDWVVGNVIDNRKHDTNNFFDGLFEQVPAEKMNDELTAFDVIVDSYLNRIEQGRVVPFNILKSLLYYSEIHLHDLNLSRREYILEEVRRQFYPERISRVNCIWLCNKAGLKGWNERLGCSKDKKIFKVMIDGELFPSTESKLPRPEASTEEQMVQAHQYWNPGKLNGKRDVEYLFEGTLTILEEITLPELEESMNEEQKFYKLVRDKIPEKIEQNGEIAVTRILDKKEYTEALRDKLFEEMLEVLDATDKKEILAECADLLEVVENITTLAGYTVEELEEEKRRKKELRGGFEKRIFLETTRKK